MNGFRLFLLCSAVLAAGCSGGARSPDFAADVAVELLEIFNGNTNVTNVTPPIPVPSGKTLALTAKATISRTAPPGTPGPLFSACPAGNPKPQPVSCDEDVDVTNEAEWSSNNTNVATIDSNGVVTAKSVGTTDIFAKLGGKTAKTSVKVDPATLEQVIVTPSATTVGQGGTATFVAQGRYSDSPNTRDLNAGTPVNWTVTPPTRATLSPTTTSGSTPTTATASSSETGPATITATVPASHCDATTADCNGTATLTVVTASFTRIVELRCVPSIVRAPTATSPATTSQCTAFAQPAGAGSAPQARPASEFDWTSSDAAKATVDPTGKVTGVAQGTTTITATLKPGVFPAITNANDRKASAPITVTGEVCTGPLLASAGATTASAASLACIGCSVSNPNNAIDGDESTAAVMSQPLGLLAGTLSLDTVQQQGLPNIVSGGPAGFLIQQPAGMLLSLELVNQITVSTLRRNASGGLDVVQTGSGRSNTLRLTLLGMLGDNTTAFVGVTTPAPTPDNGYDGLRLTFTSGIATALGTVNVFSACATATLPAP